MQRNSRVYSVFLFLLLVACVSFAQTPYTFVPTGPCRVLDTRAADGPFGGPQLAAGTVRTVTIPGNSSCWVPTTAAAYALNVTVVPNGQHLGYITVWPTGQVQPLVSTLNSMDGRTKAVAAIVQAGNNNSIDVYTTNNTELILDITGYFVGPGNPNAFYYYPLARYCELINTANPPSTDGLGGPALQAGIGRSFQVTNTQNCAIPPGATAYSLNVTATPVGGTPLGYLTIWPSDQARPGTSLINAPTGTAVSNAAIVEAGTGALSLYATADTDVEVYLNGYFGPANLNGRGGNALYAFTPCRGNDTRPYDFSNRLDYVLQTQGGCANTTLPALASSPAIQAFVLNATLVPESGIGYFPLWPYGSPMPRPTTLIALDGAITSNMAIVPAGLNGEISGFASSSTNVIYDLFGYFASPKLTILTQPGDIPSGTLHVPYTPFTMKARGGVPPYSWSANLPQGLTINSTTGVISGCPVSTQSPSVLVQVTDAMGNNPGPPFSALAQLNSLPSLWITTSSLPNGTRYVYYNQALSANGGYGSYAWTLASGSLPPGFGLSPNGVISGYYTGQNSGHWTFTVAVSDQQCPSPGQYLQTFTIRIN